MVEVLWERHIGSVMFYLLDMAQERRQACPSVVVKEKQWSFSEKGPLGYGRTLIAYAGSGPPRHSTSTYDGPGGVFTIAILKNHLTTSQDGGMKLVEVIWWICLKRETSGQHGVKVDPSGMTQHFF